MIDNKLPTFTIIGTAYSPVRFNKKVQVGVLIKNGTIKSMLCGNGAHIYMYVYIGILEFLVSS